MTTRLSVLALLATLAACAPEPAHADALPPGKPLGWRAHVEQTPLGSSQLLPPAGPRGDLGVSSAAPLYDPVFPVSAARPAPPLLVVWRGAPDDWNPPGLELRDDDDRRPLHPEPPNVPDLPRPLLLLGLAAAFLLARRLRRRIR